MNEQQLIATALTKVIELTSGPLPAAPNTVSELVFETIEKHFEYATAEKISEAIQRFVEEFVIFDSEDNPMYK